MKKAIISTDAGGLMEPLNKDCAEIIKNDNEIEISLYNSMKNLYLLGKS